MNTNDKINNFKLINNIQVDYIYFSQLATAPNIILDVQNITQCGNMLFNYTSDPDSPEMEAWYNTLKTSTNKCIDDVNDFISNITPDNPKLDDYKIIINQMINDCKKILFIIPT